MLATTQWPLERAVHLTSLVWVCVLWLPESLMELSALCSKTNIWFPLSVWNSVKKVVGPHVWISNHKHKIEEKSTKSSRSSSKVVGLGPADLWEFPTLFPLKQRILGGIKTWGTHAHQLHNLIVYLQVGGARKSFCDHLQTFSDTTHVHQKPSKFSQPFV